ncbi:MAG: hypothetical protein M1827_006305 [Pycnora praestabilis]|nr:MAG: hypothetical protein M1827_006305 [Pycnora praestabilis]
MEAAKNGKLTSFEELPTELIEEIFSYLQPGNLADLALTSRSLFIAVQTPLYRHARVPSFHALSLFVRTLNQVSAYNYKGKRWQWRKEETPPGKTIVTLLVTIDSIAEAVRSGGLGPTAILVSRLIGAVSRHCPAVNITLCLLRADCHQPPISGLETETFPCVTRLIVYVGKNSHGDEPSLALTPMTRYTSSRPAGLFGTPQLHSPQGNWGSSFCMPNARFWRPYLNGSTFPNCRTVEINHYWKTPRHGVSTIQTANEDGDRLSSSHSSLRDAVTQLGSLAGLKNLESISLEHCKEMSSTILEAIFFRRESVAAKLKILELRFCNIDYGVLHKLMSQALPYLTHFTLHVGLLSATAEGAKYELNDRSDNQNFPHLCPLVREFGRNVTCLELAVPYLCRDIFIDEHESGALLKAGICTDIGKCGGDIANSDQGVNLDRYAIRQAILEYRAKKLERRHKQRIAQAVSESEMTTASTGGSLFGGNTLSSELQVARDTEYAIDVEKQKRRRLISDARGTWRRKMISWQGLCRDHETWAEMMEEADLEEEGVEWVLANRKLSVASRHLKGTIAQELEIADVIGSDA